MVPLHVPERGPALVVAAVGSGRRAVAAARSGLVAGAGAVFTGDPAVVAALSRELGVAVVVPATSAGDVDAAAEAGAAGVWLGAGAPAELALRAARRGLLALASPLAVEVFGPLDTATALVSGARVLVGADPAALRRAADAYDALAERR